MTASAVAAPSGVAHVKTSAGLDFSRVWSSIFSVSPQKPPKSILFVSPGPQQGASTLAAGASRLLGLRLDRQRLCNSSLIIPHASGASSCLPFGNANN